jgi:ethanolamine utilization protein EutA (predicted chaperonin)
MSKIVYDKTAIFQSEIQPLIDQLQALCQQHDLPVFVMLPYAAAETEDDAIKHSAVVIYGGDSERMPDAMSVLMNLAGAGALDEAMRLVDSMFTKMAEALRKEQEARFN